MQMSYLECARGRAVTMTFAIDLKDEGITVICYCPGWCALCLLLPHCLIHVHRTLCMFEHVLRPKRGESKQYGLSRTSLCVTNSPAICMACQHGHFLARKPEVQDQHLIASQILMCACFCLWLEGIQQHCGLWCRVRTDMGMHAADEENQPEQSPEESVKKQLKLFDDMTLEGSGGYYQHTGDRLPY